MNEDKQAGICISFLLIFFAGLMIYSIFFEEDKTIPSEEQKPQVQKVKTEVLTHEIRCVEHTSNFCVRYKVFKIIKE